MSAKRVLVVGAGKRVLETALPAFLCPSSGWEIAGLRARHSRAVEAAGARLEVAEFAALSARDLEGVQLVYVAVGKAAVPQVLAHLASLEPARFALLVDTPVLVFKHFRHTALLRRFRAAWVAEDCTRLPWIDAVRAAREELGELRCVRFERSAYAYHAVATAKQLLGARVLSARRTGAGRELCFAGGARALVVEPRDYAQGHLLLEGARARMSDAPEREEGALPLVPLLEAGQCAGFRAGTQLVHLDADERALMRGDPPEARVTARMAALKRVGFLRLARTLARGEPGYPAEEGLDDMLIDYALEKLGRWRATPFSSVRSGPARALFSALSRIAGR